MKESLSSIIHRVSLLGNCTEKEYKTVAKHLARISPCNALFFGVGYDSELWNEINSNGNNLFLEDSEKWIDIISKSVSLKIEKVEYSTKISEWRKILNDQKRLIMQLPDYVWNTDWDFIFVDAPKGMKNFPGRMQSIYTASLLVAKSTGLVKILIHDYDRKVEREYCNKYFGKSHLRKIVHKMAYFKIRNGA